MLGVRIWNGKEMQYSELRWDDTVPMECSNHKDLKGRLIYENDIIRYQKYIAIVRKGLYSYNTRLHNGWYLECYYGISKSIKPFYFDVNDYLIIGNIFEDYDLYQQLKIGKRSDVLDSVG